MSRENSSHLSRPGHRFSTLIGMQQLDDARVYPGLSFQPEVPPTNHPIWRVRLTFLSRAALPKKTQARLVLALTQPPASAGKPKTFTQLGLRRPLPSRVCQGSDSSADSGGTSEGACVPEHSQAWPARQKTLWLSPGGGREGTRK